MKTVLLVAVIVMASFICHSQTSKNPLAISDIIREGCVGKIKMRVITDSNLKHGNVIITTDSFSTDGFYQYRKIASENGNTYIKFFYVNNLLHHEIAYKNGKPEMYMAYTSPNSKSVLSTRYTYNDATKDFNTVPIYTGLGIFNKNNREDTTIVEGVLSKSGHYFHSRDYLSYTKDRIYTYTDRGKTGSYKFTQQRTILQRDAIGNPTKEILEDFELKFTTHYSTKYEYYE